MEIRSFQSSAPWFEVVIVPICLERKLYTLVRLYNPWPARLNQKEEAVESMVHLEDLVFHWQIDAIDWSGRHSVVLAHL